MTEVWKTDLAPHLKYVAIAMADYAHDDGTEARPAQATLATKTGLSERQVRRTLSDLVNLGVLRVQRPAGRSKPTTYAFVMAVVHDLSSGFIDRSYRPLDRSSATVKPAVHDRLTIRTVIETKQPSSKEQIEVADAEAVKEFIKLSREALGRRSVH